MGMKFWLENQKERDPLGDPGIDVRILSKILDEQCLRICSPSCSGQNSVRDSCYYGSETPSSMIGWELYTMN
jgi:hypothetical protein